MKSPLVSPSSGRSVSTVVSPDKYIVTFETLRPSNSSWCMPADDCRSEERRVGKREISQEVGSKDRIYRADRMAARIVVDIISKEKTTQQVSFADKQVDTM